MRPPVNTRQLISTWFYTTYNITNMYSVLHEELIEKVKKITLFFLFLDKPRAYNSRTYFESCFNIQPKYGSANQIPSVYLNIQGT